MVAKHSYRRLFMYIRQDIGGTRAIPVRLFTKYSLTSVVFRCNMDVLTLRNIVEEISYYTVDTFAVDRFCGFAYSSHVFLQARVRSTTGRYPCFSQVSCHVHRGGRGGPVRYPPGGPGTPPGGGGVPKSRVPPLGGYRSPGTPPRGGTEVWVTPRGGSQVHFTPP